MTFGVLPKKLKKWPSRILKKFSIVENAKTSSSNAKQPYNKVEINLEEFDSQQSCVLISRVPIDIRRQIYRDVWGPPIFHLIRKDKDKLAFLSCQAVDQKSHLFGGCWGLLRGDGITDTRYYYFHDPIEERYFYHYYKQRGLDSTDGNILPLMLTCKLLYSECSAILYTENTFAFRDDTTYYQFCSLINVQSLHSIRYLHIQVVHLEHGGESCFNRCVYETQFPTEESWNAFWTSLQQFPGLRSLEIVIPGTPIFWQKRLAARGLQGTTDVSKHEEENSYYSLLAPLRELCAVKDIDRVDVLMHNILRFPLDPDEKFTIRFQGKDEFIGRPLIYSGKQISPHRFKLPNIWKEDEPLA